MTNLIGPDVSIEISLKEYGIAWVVIEEETMFYYGIKHAGENFIRFDHCWFDNNMDIMAEYDWINLQRMIDANGISVSDWESFPLEQKIHCMLNYYGYENVFGPSYGEGLTYEEVIKEGEKE